MNDRMAIALEHRDGPTHYEVLLADNGLMTSIVRVLTINGQAFKMVIAFDPPLPVAAGLTITTTAEWIDG
jgi:hypothetical protein